MGLAQEFGLICEGFDTTFIPEAAYVQQNDKVFICWDDNKILTESSFGEGVTLVESLDELELEERTINGKTVKHPKEGKWTVEGPYQLSDTRNLNDREYRRRIWQKQLGEDGSPIQKRIKNTGGLVGHLEHPQDGRTDGNKGALVTRSLKLRESGVVWGKSEILDTPGGMILQEYTKKKIRWGVSSRGNGSVDDKGYVNDDYMLETFDAVMKPSTPGAFPRPVTSTKEGKTQTQAGELTEEAEQCVAQAKSLVETATEDLDEAAQTKLAGELLKTLGHVNSLANSDAMPSSKAYEIQDWLTKKLKGLQEQSGADWEDVLDEVIGEGDDEVNEGEQEAALRRVVASFNRRITAAVEETEQLQRQVEEADAHIEAAEAQVEVVAQERDDALDLLESSQQSLKDTQLQLDIATSVIADRSVVEVEDLVNEAVEKAVEQVPRLDKFRHLLERGHTAEDVEHIAETLLPLIVNSEPRETTPTEPRPDNRRALPVAIVESEKGMRGTNGRPATTHRGARTAGAALAKMKTQPQQT